MRKFGKGLHQNKNMIFINKKVAAVLLSLVVFTIPCYANETQCTILNATADKDSDTIYFPKFLSFEAKSDLFYIEGEAFETNHYPYLLENGMIMIPLRDLFDVIRKAEKTYHLTACDLIWYENTKQIEYHIAQRCSMIQIEDSKISFNGEEPRALEYPLVNKENTIYISLKDIAVMFGNSFSQNFYDIENNRFGVWV